MSRSFLLMCAGGIAAIVLLIAAGTAWYERPARLTVAVSKGDPDDVALMTAAAGLLKGGKPELRMKVLEVEDAAAAAKAVQDDKADLAVVRTDIAMPPNGRTVVILHRDPAVMMTASSSGIRAVADLKGHRVGIVRDGPGNGRLLEAALEQYDVPSESVAREAVPPEAVAEAIRTKRVDAVLVVGILADPIIRQAVSAFMEGDGEPAFIPVPEAAAMAQRGPAYDSTEILRGAFGGSPPRPAEAYDTLSVTHRLVASQDVAQGTIADLTRFFLSQRPALAALSPLAQRMEAPSTDKGTALPAHAGTAAYIDDEEETFFDKYSDMIYLGAMFLGVVASGATALIGRVNSRKAAALDGVMGRLMDLLTLVRTASSAAVLDEVQAEADGILGSVLTLSAGTVDEKRMQLFSLALDQLRAAIRDRRAALSTRLSPEGGSRRIAIAGD